ncbi:MAG: tRNA (guanosine(37)-N1)-methyltransferase TrmD [Candidatus Liptonbacteria bacterium]
MRFDIATIFPHIFDSYINESLFMRARKNKIISVYTHNLRDYLSGPKDRVDDRPFGGGPGMVLKVEPIYRAVQDILKNGKRSRKKARNKSRIILFSTRGKKLNAKEARRLSKYNQLIFICGHYEGVDERVAEHIADEELSIGDYVLSGGELAAMVAAETISRFLPGFLGTGESLEEIKGSYPVYSRPAEFSPGTRNVKIKKTESSVSKQQQLRPWKVPKVLLSGNHKKIAAWRKQT